jgi:hypothetical protein
MLWMTLAWKVLTTSTVLLPRAAKISSRRLGNAGEVIDAAGDPRCRNFLNKLQRSGFVRRRRSCSGTGNGWRGAAGAQEN